MRSRSERKSERKAPSLGDYEVVPAPDSTASQQVCVWWRDNRLDGKGETTDCIGRIILLQREYICIISLTIRFMHLKLSMACRGSDFIPFKCMLEILEKCTFVKANTLEHEVEMIAQLIGTN